MTGEALEPVTQRPVFVHPGFVKTATSTLQRHVFARHPQIHFLGLPSPTPELEWAVRHVCQADSVHLEPGRLRDALARGLAGAGEDRVPLVSYENYALYESTDKGLVAQRLERLFPQARVFFTIRRQQDLVRSWYLTKLRLRIKRKAFIPFEEWYWLEAREPWQSILDDLRYGRTIEAYVRLFGRERVAVFPFEELRRDPRRFAGRIADFLGVDGERFFALMAGKRENAAMSQRYFAFWRRFNHLLPRKLVRKWSMRMAMRDGPPARVALPDDVAAHIAGLVAADNARLAAEFGLDLAALGYSVAGEAPPRA